jgi:hypothetical protein
MQFSIYPVLQDFCYDYDTEQLKSFTDLQSTLLKRELLVTAPLRQVERG